MDSQTNCSKHLNMATTKLSFLYLRGYEDDVLSLILIVIVFWICLGLFVREMYASRKLRNLQRRGVSVPGLVMNEYMYHLTYQFDTLSALLVDGWIRRLADHSQRHLEPYIHGIIRSYCGSNWSSKEHLHTGIYAHKEPVARQQRNNLHNISIIYDPVSPKTNMPSAEFAAEYELNIINFRRKCMCFLILTIASFSLFCGLAAVLKRGQSSWSVPDMLWIFILFLIFSAERLAVIICLLISAVCLCYIYQIHCMRCCYYTE